ncbi:hypothetical protein BDN72DRAFT_301281 [Pluteus cervinus]|uniref:Uncharacterized protein n=1 Tax=Pluteus cervinus TaxID=181527 RepID=A0ACD3ADK8_9AGAR|nr:hypothetical protein BDN72DRAFT_301281 [Pluteus cervinus]
MTPPPMNFIAEVSPRDNTVAGLWQKMMQYSFVWVRGPYRSGKSILAELIHHHARKVLPSATVIPVAGRRATPKDREETWTYLNRRRRRGFPTIFIFDSAQRAYGNTILWPDFFNDLCNQQSKDVYAIVFASYGNPLSRFEINGRPMDVDVKRRITSSPIDHNDGCPAIGLLLTKEEFGDVIKRRYDVHDGHIFEEKLLTKIFGCS